MFAFFQGTRKVARRAIACLSILALAACSLPARVGLNQNTGQTIDPSAPVQVALLVPGAAGGAGDALISSSLENAARMAIADLNGVDINLRVYNTAGDPVQAGQVANAAVADGAQIILGPLRSDSANAAGLAVAGQNINVLSFSNTTSIAGGNVFILGSTFSNTANRLVQYASRQGITRYTVVHGNDTPGQVGRDAIANAVRASGGQVTAIEGYALTQAGVTEAAPRIVAAARNGGSDAVFFTGDPSGDLPFILNGLNAAGLSPSDAQFLGLTRWDANAEVFANPAAQGGFFALPDQALQAQFKNRYAAIYGGSPHPLAGLAYDGIAAIGALVAQGNANALTKSGLTTPEGFRGTGGIFRFLSNGRNQRGLSVATIQNNTVSILEPAPRSFGGSGL
ncbi:MAG: penicillin-binding protein activator [Pseudomonadota bacterium]